MWTPKHNVPQKHLAFFLWQKVVYHDWFSWSLSSSNKWLASWHVQYQKSKSLSFDLQILKVPPFLATLEGHLWVAHIHDFIYFRWYDCMSCLFHWWCNLLHYPVMSCIGTKPPTPIATEIRPPNEPQRVDYGRWPFVAGCVCILQRGMAQLLSISDFFFTLGQIVGGGGVRRTGRYLNGVNFIQRKSHEGLLFLHSWHICGVFRNPTSCTTNKLWPYQSSSVLEWSSCVLLYMYYRGRVNTESCLFQEFSICDDYSKCKWGDYCVV